MKRLVKAGLERFGYRIVRRSPLASDPAYEIALDFEYVLAHYLRRRALQRPFFFVQVGAFDGVSSDPLHEHVVEGGWQGVLVEPQPRYFERLVENYAGMKGLDFVNAALDRQAGSRPLYQVQDEQSDPIDSHAGLASFSRDRLLNWQSRVGDRAPAGSRIGSVPVRCVTFEELLAETEYVDLLHLDVEGYELELLRIFDFARFAPAIVRFEHAHLMRSDWNEAVRLLAGHGYRMLREEYETTAYRP
jgi:FkbM family methyltransferase